MKQRKVVQSLQVVAGLLSVASLAAARPLIISQSTSGGNGPYFHSPSLSANGSIAFYYDGDLTGGNAGHNPEVFRFDTATNTITQVTSTLCTPSVRIRSFFLYGGASGSIAFAAGYDPTGANPAGTFEIFRFDPATNAIIQITNSTGAFCGNANPAMSTNGSIAFASNCDLTGGNPDGNSEIFHFDPATNAFTQITRSTSCTSFPSSSIADGSIAFTSNCDLTGGNPDGNFEVFRFDAATNSVSQVTNSTGYCGLDEPASLSASGSGIAFQSNCDLTGGNPDGHFQIFLFDAVTDTITQITNSTGPCLSAFPSLSANGSIAFDSTCDPTGANPDGNLEIFVFDAVTKRLTQITHSTGYCANGIASLNALGSIAFQSTCDLTGGNPEGNREIFLATPRHRR